MYFIDVCNQGKTVVPVKIKIQEILVEDESKINLEENDNVFPINIKIEEILGEEKTSSLKETMDAPFSELFVKSSPSLESVETSSFGENESHNSMEKNKNPKEHLVKASQSSESEHRETFFENLKSHSYPFEGNLKMKIMLYSPIFKHLIFTRL